MQSEIKYVMDCPPVWNDSDQTQFARQVAISEFGNEKVQLDFKPVLASEDFAFMLQETPGCFLFVGNGLSAPLHNSKYNFNDEVLHVASRYWIALVKSYLIQEPI